MSVQEEINRINQNIANTYSVLNEKGATLPTNQNSDNLANTVRSVPQGGTSGGGEDKILRVTAIAIPTSMTDGYLGEISRTFQEIQDAYNNGKTIFFNIDVGAIAPNTVFVMPLCIIEQNHHICCTTIIDMSGTLTYIQFFIIANNEGSFIIKQM